MSLPVPRLVAWELTRACNLKCRHCRASAVESGDGDLSFDEAKRVVDDIASFARPILILTGGEPLLCPYLFDLIAYARSRGLRPVVGTNATLIDEDVAARLASAGIPRISVSIDFPTAAAHDAFRGVEGSFEKAVSGIRLARAAGIEVQVNTTVTRLNRSLLDDIHALAVSLDVQAFHPFLLVPTGRGADLANVELTAREYEETLLWVHERQKTSPLELKPTDAPQYQRIVRQAGGCGMHGKGCLAGTGFVFVGHAGDVKPCGYFDLKLGNVRTTPLSEIWRTSPVLDDLRHPERLKGKCGACEYANACGGCRARALARTGDYLSEEPFCAHVPDRILLDRVQDDFPLVERPYAALGESLGLSEDACYARVLELRARGLVRRVGASFVPRRLGYVTTLAAAQVAVDRLDDVAASVGACAEVTHSYAREGAYNLWFTVIAPSQGRIERILAEIGACPGVERMRSFPASKMYKLRAVFSTGKGATAGICKSAVPVASKREGRPVDAAFVRTMQGDILDRGLDPFSADELAELKKLLADGTIRRFGALVNHRAIGILANALVVWEVPANRLDAAGAALSASPSVSHCYARMPYEDWPYNLYAMVHARTDAELAHVLSDLESAVRESTGTEIRSRVLKTLHEYKKTSFLPDMTRI